ncbi:UNVERIFIED_CONTAM: Transcription factor NIG [Sesamum angustifolium]|uniref:Transcription factor NIG n=1 Tax=Sesamum angustifolium TaxID=2727405 RepID=A0AAW2PAR1_9LAMI
MITSPHDIHSMHLNSCEEQKTEETQKLQDFVARLEEERLKIDAFKRELPLCAQLLAYAVKASRQELESQRTNQLEARPVLEEFIPLKDTSWSEVNENAAGNASADKANWMTSAQLWNLETEGKYSTKETDTELALTVKHGISAGGGFLPSPRKSDRNSSSCGAAFPELALSSSHKEETVNTKNSLETTSRSENSGEFGNSSIAEKERVRGTPTTTQTHRKPRRCWSPDLHRRFVHALHMLGGSQVATPKQIRELMKVDGLTNDEVKSHLQKYRLHTSLSPSPQAAMGGAPKLVVLGGIWVPPEYAAAAAHTGAAAAPLYGAHAATNTQILPSFCSPAPSVPQEIYHAVATPHPPPRNQLHHHAVHLHQFHV